MTALVGLKCRACGAPYPAEAVYVCEQCLGPLGVVLDEAVVRKTLSRASIESRPRSLWRYREVLPVLEPGRVGPTSGMTPLLRAERLGRAIGHDDCWVKDDSVNHPTCSYKDRVVPVALSRALELGFTTVSCASTGNLANSVSAHAARAGLRCVIFIPDGLERGKILGSAVFRATIVAVRGNYDQVNRLCTELAERHRWAFVNVNLRPYYVEGAKTFGWEIVEQLGWRLPRHAVLPTAGGTLLPKVAEAFEEAVRYGCAEGAPVRIYTAQAAGSAPVVRALHAGLDRFEPVKPQTIAKSIAIGNPADGNDVLRIVRASGGWGEMATDEEIVSAIRLLAETEGIFTEPAGGTTVAVARKLVAEGKIPKNETLVIGVTGNGYKTQEAVVEALPAPRVVNPKVREVEETLAGIPGWEDAK
ncbi:MAG: threonine synthase [Planctomycetales bacterium]|nr:threonine synthase [Planctomycetales bacterium]